jgi:hypothetical protein
MIKLILLSSVISAAFFAGGRVHYSGLQLQQPFGSAFKMTPDPSNIWSHHETIARSAGGINTVTILVDFDNDGKMDSLHKGVRILVTDISIRANADATQFELVDDTGTRWVIPYRNRASNSFFYFGDHLLTPLAVPVGSGLKLTYSCRQGGERVDVHVIGRLVTL